MKKIISLIVILLFITGCGKKEEGFYLTYNNKNINLGEVFDVNIHGQYNDMFESENCAFGDRDITYIYDNIEIETYGNKKNELIIYSIVLSNENFKNNEGIGLYDSIDDAIKKYGDKYERDDNKYTYVKGDTSLIFIVDNNLIESIEYRLNNIE